MNVQEQVLSIAKRHVDEDGLKQSEAIAKVFRDDPALYESYCRESSSQCSQTPERDARTIELKKTVGQLAAEGIAKQLVAKHAAEDMDAALDQVFRMRPDLYELHAREICSPRSVSAA